MKIFLIAIAVSSASLLILVILLQQGKGAELGAAFGQGARGGLVSAQGKANFLTRITSALVTVFLLSSLALSIFLGGSQQDGVYQELQGESAADAIVEDEEIIIGGTSEPAQNSEQSVTEAEAAAEEEAEDSTAEQIAD